MNTTLRSPYSRLERRRRRQWIATWVILVAAVLAWVVTLVWAVERQGQEEAAEIHFHVNPPAVSIEELKAEIAVRTDHPNPFFYRQEIPLDKYLQETLYSAAMEWGVPYELAVAVCWRETQYRNLVTPVEMADGEVRTYYGMMAVCDKYAQEYMALCGIDNLDTEENRLRVGCCMLGQHIKNEGSVRAALCRYSGDDEGWYADDVLRKMGELMA